MEDNNMSGGLIVASELLMTFIQAWVLFQKKQGLTDKQISEAFATTFSKFTLESSVPVDPVKR